MPASRNAQPRAHGLRLRFPHAATSVASGDLVFRWTLSEAPSTVRYRLSIFPLRPGQSLAKAALSRPIYSVAGLRTTEHRFPTGTHKLAFGKAYCWKVEAVYPNGKIAGSALGAFRCRPNRPLPPATVSIGDRLGLLDPAMHLPHAPFVWGHPVRWRFRTALPEIDGGAGGATEPGWKWGLWGTEAGRLFLIEPYWSNARVSWDYSDQPGCEQVLLQIAGPDGFMEPNSMHAREDAGVAAWYLGPATMPDTCLGMVIDFEGDPHHHVPTYEIDLQYTGEAHEFWDSLAVRLVPLDAAGNQTDVASDHVSVGCEDPPLITMETCNVEWVWGPLPMRRIEFTIRLGRAFPSTGETAPSTLAIKALTPWNINSISRAVLTNVRLLNDDGGETGVSGSWDGNPAYFSGIPRWVEGSLITLTLEQQADAIGGSTGQVQQLIHFTDLHLLVHCIPGLTPSTYTCGQSLSDGSFLEIPCAETFEGHHTEDELHGYDLNAGHIESGFDAVFQLLTRPLSGTRHTVRTIDGDEQEDERDVTVEFRYTEEFEDAEDFKLYLLRTGPGGGPCSITMVERSGGATTEYAFRMLGFFATMETTAEPFIRYGGTDSISAGRLIFDPPHLRMEFQADRSYWDSSAVRGVEDIEVAEYDLSY
ncbi:MAG: hypothetical protein AB7P40_04335 [Chloroflexota bacterium]